MVAIRHSSGTSFGRALDQLFHDVLGNWNTAWPVAGPSLSFPALNLWQDADAFHLETEIPGVRREDLELSLKGRELRLAGERKRTLESKPVHDERGFGRFERIVRLPEDVDAAQVQADLQDGVLRITLPKAAHTKPRQIEIGRA